MTARSRRTFLKLGAVTAAGAAVAPGFAGSAGAEESSAPAHDGAFVAWVKDPRAGEIAVLVGDRELTVRDRPLAKRLAQAAARAQQ
jgi:anaerobic selenocysteine-containing dehydrogenase